MQLEQMSEMEYMKRELQALEREEKNLLEQLERVQASKNNLLEQIAKNTDEDYEKYALTKLYEQRRMNK